MEALEIKKYVEKELGLKISSKTRKREYVYARSVYFKLCRDFTDMGLVDIGYTLDLNHPAVIHSIRNVFPIAIKYDSNCNEAYTYFRKMNTNDVDGIEQKHNFLLSEHSNLKKKYKELEEVIRNLKIENRFEMLINRIPEDRLDLAYDRIEAVVNMIR